MTMSSQWFVKKPNETRRGPLTDAELKRQALNGELARTDLIWCEGLDMAIPAGGLPGLFPPPPRVAESPAPVEPSRVPEPPPLKTDAQTNVTETKEGEEDIFSWYRPGDPRAPLLVNWLDLWQFVHMIGRRHKRLFTLIPMIATPVFGLLLGAASTFVPLVLVNYIVIIGAGIAFGEGIYECFRLGNGGRFLEGSAKFRAILFGLAAALVAGYFYTVGILLVDEKLGKDMAMSQCFMPWNIVYYVQTKSQALVVAGFTDIDKMKPQFIWNCLMIGAEYLILLLVVTTSAGGGRRDVKKS